MSRSRQQPPTPKPNRGILFQFADIEREIKNFDHISRPFLDERFEYVLGGWLGSLVHFRESRRSGSWRWQITDSNPVRTQETNEYEVGDKRGNISIYGELTSIWEIELDERGRRTGQVFCLSGIASTMIKIFHVETDQNARSDCAMAIRGRRLSVAGMPLPCWNRSIRRKRKFNPRSASSEYPNYTDRCT